MEPERSGAKGEEGSTGASGRLNGPVAARRVYPRPPGIFRRFVRLCLVPESWPEMGRYPFHVTLIPLLMAIVLSAGLTGAGLSHRMMDYLRGIAAGYDAHYAPMKISSDGVLSVAGGWWSNKATKITLSPQEGMQIVVDPTNQTKMEDIPTVWAMLVSGTDLRSRFMGEEQRDTLLHAFGPALPEKGQSGIIDQANLTEFLDEGGMVLALLAFGLVFGFKLMSGLLWSALMVATMWPLAVIAGRMGEGELFIPRRGAVRLAAAVLVPLLMVEGILEAVGYPLRETVGPEFNLLVWSIASGVLCFWAGRMAKRMYGVQQRRGRG